MESVNLRNLEQIQETEAGYRSSRLLAWLLGSVGVTGLAVALATATTGQGVAPGASSDPLGALVSQARLEARAAPDELRQSDLSFPSRLSDQPGQTTALAVVRDERGRLVEQTGAASATAASATPPLGSERLPIVPAGLLLGSKAATREAQDPMVARAVTRDEPAGEPAPPGSEGGYQLQVASFKEQTDAEALVNTLRRRGHRAYRQAAYVPGRGLWHRVRIGPFKDRFEAQTYRRKFEQMEHMAPLLIDPLRNGQPTALPQSGGRGRQLSE